MACCQLFLLKHLCIKIVWTQLYVYPGYVILLHLCGFSYSYIFHTLFYECYWWIMLCLKTFVLRFNVCIYAYTCLMNETHWFYFQDYTEFKFIAMSSMSIHVKSCFWYWFMDFHAISHPTVHGFLTFSFLTLQYLTQLCYQMFEWCCIVMQTLLPEGNTELMCTIFIVALHICV